MTMGWWNDNNAAINSGGNLSLGGGGYDDASAHATYGYAKNDVTYTVPASIITGDTLPALTYATGDIPIRALAASTTHKVTIPFPEWFNRTFTAAVGQTANPHGILIKSLTLFYRVNTTNITSFATMPINTTPLAAAAALPTVTALTTTLAGNTLTQAANVYAAVSTVTTPAFINTANTLVWGLATIVIPGSSTVDLLGASWSCAYAMY